MKFLKLFSFVILFSSLYEISQAQPYHNPNDSEIIWCKSTGYRYNFCSTRNAVLEARLVEQLSHSDCSEGYSWGHNRDGIWVDHGCEANFEVIYRRRRPAQEVVITCASEDYRFNRCYVDGNIIDAHLQRQISNSRCDEGSSWGIDQNSIWVDHGCRGDFLIRYRRR